MSLVNDIVNQNHAGEIIALASVCTAHPDVLSASLLLAQKTERAILIEATSNQVNQFGGYTGMTPQKFISYVRALAKDLGVESSLFVFGGDHLGPQVWRAEAADIAMSHAKDLMRAYVEAGFTKIHLDCSEGCAGELAQVDDDVSATRAAALAAVCETYAPDASLLSYVIGTEVPPPGGARADEVGQTITPTRPEHARHTLERHHTAFTAEGLAAAWDRVIGLVVQPGLEFSPTHIERFDVGSPDELSAVLSEYPHISFEAHSTDYQFDDVYPELARRHFAIHKVGPALTFACRQALYALDGMSQWIDTKRSGTDLSDAMEKLMLEKPHSWCKHYEGDETQLRLHRHFAYADRIRYYWPEPAAQGALSDLFGSLTQPAPTPLIQQYFAPNIIEQAKVLEQGAGSWARALVWAQIQDALRPYLFGKTG